MGRLGVKSQEVKDLQTRLGANRYNHNEIVVKSTENVVEIKSQVC